MDSPLRLSLNHYWSLLGSLETLGFSGSTMLTWTLFFTLKVEGYTRFVEKYVTGKTKRFRPYKVHIFYSI